MKNFIYYCSNCGGTNVQRKVWVNPNTNELGESISNDQEDCWCNDCQKQYDLDVIPNKKEKILTMFRISLEIELEADSPLNAAKEAQNLFRNDNWQYYVQDTETHQIFSVDLQEEDDDAVLPVNEYQPIIK
jgi:hypothetical protein